MFALPPAYGFARAAVPCRTCGRTKPCALTTPTFIRGNVLVTATDICVSGLVAAQQRYEYLVAAGCLDTGSACVSNLVERGPLEKAEKGAV